VRRAPPPNPLTPDSRHLFPVPPFLIHSHGHIGYLDPIGIGQVGRHARNLAVLRIVIQMYPRDHCPRTSMPCTRGPMRLSVSGRWRSS
jgi:hypothetical protein